MKITHVTIHNFRSIRDCKLQCRDMLVLLGQNNHGKSNVISALDFALNSSRKPDKEDFFAFRESDDHTMWVEVTFDRLTDEEKEKLKKYVQDGDTFCFRKTAKYDDKGKVDVAYNGYVSEPEEEWLKADNASKYKKRDEVSKTPLKDYVPESGTITQDHVKKAQEKYIEAHRAKLKFGKVLEKGLLCGKKNVAAGVLPEFFLIPAVRDLSDESKVKSTAFFGKLLNLAVTEMISKDSHFRNIDEQIKKLINVLNARPDSEDDPHQLVKLESSIKGNLSEWNDVRSVSVEVTPLDMRKIFELGTNIYIDDGHKTLAQHKGHGLQRAVIFCLIKAWAEAMPQAAGGTTARKASESVVFAIEEPELFLHPHAQRALDKALRMLAKRDNSQVLIASHSTHFVNLNDYRGIALIRKSAKTGTEVVQCLKDLFEGEDDRKEKFNMAAWVNPDRGEMFFARRVAFVEGQTEKSVFPYLAEKMGLAEKKDVSIIDCGSKNNIPLYISIANAFRLNYIVVHDEDDPNCSSNKKMNEEISAAVSECKSGSLKVLHQDFEDCGEISCDKGKRKQGKALAALDHFRSVSAAEIPKELAETIKMIYKKDAEDML